MFVLKETLSWKHYFFALSALFCIWIFYRFIEWVILALTDKFWAFSAPGCPLCWALQVWPLHSPKLLLAAPSASEPSHHWIRITFVGIICWYFSDFPIRDTVFHSRVRWCSLNIHSSRKYNLYNSMLLLSCTDWKHLGFKSCFLLDLRSCNTLSDPCSAVIWLMEQAVLFQSVRWRQRLFRSCFVACLVCFPHSPNARPSLNLLLCSFLTAALLSAILPIDFVCWGWFPWLGAVVRNWKSFAQRRFWAS